MKPCFKLDAARDIVLLPYSPVYEDDPLEIRCQVYNEGDDGEVTLTFCLDGEDVYAETVFVKKQCYGFAKWIIDVHGKSGKHTVSINGESVSFEVTDKRRPALDGGFVMLGPPNDRVSCRPFCRDIKRMTDDDWRRYIGELARIGQSCVIIMAAYQYLSITDGTLCAHFDSQLYPKSDIAAEDPIAAILTEAEKHGTKVFIGIGNAYGWPGTADCFGEVYRRYAAYPAFYGWYMGYEFDMLHFDPQRAEEFASLVAAARRLSPVKPILASPYERPEREFVEYITAHDVFDIMMPQDCVGQERLTLQGSENAYQVLQKTCRATRKHLWANCEAFNFAPAEIDGQTQNVLVPRYKGGGMDGDAGFIRQMQVARPYCEKMVTFMFSGFFCPPDFEPAMGGEAAIKQYEDYVKYAKYLFD